MNNFYSLLFDNYKTLAEYKKESEKKFGLCEILDTVMDNVEEYMNKPDRNADNYVGRIDYWTENYHGKVFQRRLECRFAPYMQIILINGTRISFHISRKTNNTL